MTQEEIGQLRKEMYDLIDEAFRMADDKTTPIEVKRKRHDEIAERVREICDLLGIEYTK
jgi:hypothetical protein